jgi:pteridine reductase
MKRMSREFVPPKSQIALVTGATSTLGIAICEKLGQQGFCLALHYGRSKEKAIKLQKNLTSWGIESLLLQADLSKPSRIGGIIHATIRRWGRLDLLVNNAALFKPTPIEEENWRDWVQLLRVNLFSPFALAVAAKPWLKKTNGNIINICDIYGELPSLKDHVAYSVSKAALIFLTKYMAVEFAPELRVNGVSPGVISFPKTYNEKKRKKLIERSALKKQGTPSQIANAVWFLASNPFITGQVLKVDGGRFIS